MNKLLTIAEASSAIQSGHCLSLAGSEEALDQLPAGNWVAGTIPYFMTQDGGVVDRGHVFVTDLSVFGAGTVTSYAADNLEGISRNCPETGFALTIIPAGSQCHQRFAAEASTYEFAFLKPTVGWIAGMHLSDLGTVSAKVYDGRTKTKYEDQAVVAYLTPAGDKLPVIEIVNLFEPGDGDLLRFNETSFATKEVVVNGEKRDFSAYIREKGFDHGQLPLVGDFAGARINVSLQSVGQAGEPTTMYAPVFTGVDYRFARPIGSYAQSFRERLAGQENEGTVFSCNCILNFLFGELEGKKIGGADGPVTFGEIAYQLLNQTQVAVRLV